MPKLIMTVTDEVMMYLTTHTTSTEDEAALAARMLSESVGVEKRLAGEIEAKPNPYGRRLMDEPKAIASSPEIDSW